MKTDNVPSHIILPDWPVPAHVKAFSTTRHGGVSEGAFCSNNLALHVNDKEADVAKNRALLRNNIGLPSEPFWLNQTHTTTVVSAHGSQKNADASFSDKAGEVCIVMTADCLPVLLCDKAGKQIAAVHAGWRGLLNGIIENALCAFSAKGRDVVAWLGPAIGPNAFEVGDEVKQMFVKHDAAASAAFCAHGEDKWLADIYHLARMRLSAVGVVAIYGGEYCTFHNKVNSCKTSSSKSNSGADFFSYRRDNVCGRMATGVWLDK